LAKAPKIHSGDGSRTSRKAAKEAAAVVAAAGAAAVGAKLARDKLAARTAEEREYRLHPDETVPDGIRRIMGGQLDDAAEELEGASSRTLGKAVHEARKRTKRMRAAVRVSRDALGDEAYQRANRAFRITGRMLSGPRDAQVLIETLDALVERFGDELSKEAVAPLRARLVREHRRAIKSLKDGGVVETVLMRLKNGRRRTPNWVLNGNGFAALSPGLARVYRRGRRAMRKAAKNPTSENLHEWRKRAKDFWHALELVYPAAPKRTTKLAKRAHRLSDLLGDDHDLAVLREYVTAHPEVLDKAVQATLLALIDKRRRVLQRDALSLGARLYRKRPKQFVRALERGWNKRVAPPAPAAAAASG
jgi:CHAD domain-containing protein